MEEKLTEVNKIYSEDSAEEMHENSRVVDKMVVEVENILNGTRIMSQSNTIKVCEQIDEVIKQQILNSISRDRDMNSQEVVEAVKQKVDRQTQKDEEDQRARKMVLKIEQVFEELQQRFTRVLEMYDSRYVEDSIVDLKRTLNRGKDEIIDIYMGHTVQNQKVVDDIMSPNNELTDTLKGQLQSLEDQFPPNATPSIEDAFHTAPKNLNNKDAFHTAPKNLNNKDAFHTEPKELDASWLK